MTRKPKLSPTQEAFAKEVLRPYLNKKKLLLQEPSLEDRVLKLEKRVERIAELLGQPRVFGGLDTIV